MQKKLIILVLVVIIIAAALIFLFTPHPIEESGYQSEVIITNLDTPWAIAFLPDDRMIFTERGGKVKIWDGNQVSDVGNINVKEVSESGLLGITVDPDYNKNQYIYLYYTSQNNGNQVSRFQIKNNNLTNETVLLGNIPSSGIHNGGRIKFGPDGKLYITTGDAGDEPLAQDINSLAGKILRMNKDGSIPEDNPFGNYVYSYGHRNPQGITWDTSNGLMYASEHGPTRNDEINIIEKGGNYGWPIVQCDNTTDQYINSLRCFNEFTLAPSGIAFYENSLFVTGLRGNQLRRLVLDSSGKKIISEEELFNNLGRIRDVVEYKGYLYIATSNSDGRGVPKIGDDKIIRIKTGN
ncbi:MAG: PQQ-dependent sugar dehydrogenase [Methanobacteriaceae archaeon]